VCLCVCVFVCLCSLLAAHCAMDHISFLLPSLIRCFTVMSDRRVVVGLSSGFVEIWSFVKDSEWRKVLAERGKSWVTHTLPSLSFLSFTHSLFLFAPSLSLSPPFSLFLSSRTFLLSLSLSPSLLPLSVWYTSLLVVFFSLLAVHTSEVTSCDVSPLEDVMCTASLDGIALVWRLKERGGEGEGRRIALQHDVAVEHCRFAKDSSCLAVLTSMFRREGRVGRCSLRRCLSSLFGFLHREVCRLVGSVEWTADWVCDGIVHHRDANGRISFHIL
jgi:WD40 repeat protein